MLRELAPGTTIPASGHRDPELLNSLVVPAAILNLCMMLWKLLPYTGRSSPHLPAFGAIELFFVPDAILNTLTMLRK